MRSTSSSFYLCGDNWHTFEAELFKRQADIWKIVDIAYVISREGRERFNNIQIFEFYLTSFRALADKMSVESVFREKGPLSRKRKAQNGR